jgi:thioredoxin reductase (NADPH)
VEVSNGRVARSRSILIASGAQYRTLDVANLSNFLGSGVYYAATHLEARLCDGEDAIVVGGGNSAGQAAVFLAGYCRHVDVMVRGPGLADSVSLYLIRRIDTTSNISLRTRTRINALDGDDHLERVTWTSADGASQTCRLRHLFLMLGASPNTRWLAGQVALDAAGFVLTGTDLTPRDVAGWKLSRPPCVFETSVPNIFAAGDVRPGSTKRIAAAVGEGSTVVQFVHRVLREAAESSAAATAG